MTTNPTTPSIEQDAETVLRTIRTWKVPPSWADLWMHSGLPEHRLSAALRRLLYRTKQITCEGNLTEGWRYKTVTTSEQLAPQGHVECVIKVVRAARSGRATFEYICDRVQTYRIAPTFANSNDVQRAINEAVRQGRLRRTDDRREWVFVWPKSEPAFPPHIDIVVEAIRKSGGEADREAIWGRSPGLSWEEVDRAIEAAMEKGEIYNANLTGSRLRGAEYRVTDFSNGRTSRTYTMTAAEPALTSFRRRALIDALLRGHHSITDAVIAAGEAWWQTADPLLRDLVANGEINLQWSPPNGDTPGKMHYFKRKEAA